MRKWYPWVVSLIGLAFSVVVFNRLPDQMATHWDLSGDVNGYSSRAVGAFLLPALSLVVTLILQWLPSIDPRRENYPKFRPSYDLVVNAAITLLLVVHVGVLGKALGWPISMGRFAPLIIGGLFVVLGNVLPKSRPNWWFGIRTPWTLTNDRVWERTHRVGGYLFVAGGVALMLLTAIPPKAEVVLLVVIVAVTSIIPIVFSYVAWKQETSK